MLKLFSYFFLVPLAISADAAVNLTETQLLQTLPRVTLSYAEIFDNVCTVKANYKINSVWVQELKKELPRWRELWNQEGILLLKTTAELTSKPFVQKDFQVSLSLCSSLQ